MTGQEATADLVWDRMVWAERAACSSIGFCASFYYGKWILVMQFSMEKWAGDGRGVDGVISQLSDAFPMLVRVVVSFCLLGGGLIPSSLFFFPIVSPCWIRSNYCWEASSAEFESVY